MCVGKQKSEQKKLLSTKLVNREGQITRKQASVHHHIDIEAGLAVALRVRAHVGMHPQVNLKLNCVGSNMES